MWYRLDLSVMVPDGVTDAEHIVTVALNRSPLILRTTVHECDEETD